MVSPDRWNTAKERFAEASELPRLQQAAYLQALQESDRELFEIIQDLLVSAEETVGFLESPPWNPPVATGAMDRSLIPGQMLGDRFEVESFLGSGGAGEVYRAWDRERQIWLAVKTLKPGFLRDGAALDALRNELNIASRISHRNVCRLSDLRADITPPFFTMELLDGETLSVRARRQRFTETEALPVAQQLVEGLTAAHEIGIIHRDLKSANVMLTEDGARAVIMDFGLAREVVPGEDVQVTMTQGLMGTPSYMAPEVIRGKRATRASDIHSLGVILFEMVTGQLPFDGDSAVAVASERLAKEAPSPRHFVPNLDVRWEHAILRCLASEPGDRPASALEVLTLLGSTPPLFNRFNRRKFAYAAMVAAVGGGGFYQRKQILNVVLGSPKLGAEADAHYQRGIIFSQRRSREGTEGAIQEFRQTIKFQPDWAPAWAELAETLASGANFAVVRSAKAMEEARAAAERAIQLQPDLARGHSALAFILSLDYKEWPKADAAFRNALRLDNNDARTHHRFATNLRKRGLFEQAEEQIKSALQLAPGDARSGGELALLYFTAGRLKEFHDQAEDQARLYPQDSMTILYQARSRAIRGRIDDARRLLDQSKTLDGNPATILIERGLLEAIAGNREKARVYANQVEQEAQENPTDGLMLAGVYARIGERDKAFRVIERAFQAQDTSLLSLATSPLVEPLRRDPRFLLWTRRLGFADKILR